MAVIHAGVGNTNTTAAWEFCQTNHSSKLPALSCGNRIGQYSVKADMASIPTCTPNFASILALFTEALHPSTRPIQVMSTSQWLEYSLGQQALPFPVEP